MVKFPEVRMGGSSVNAEWYPDGYEDDDRPVLVIWCGLAEEVYHDEEAFLRRYGSFGAWLLVCRHASAEGSHDWFKLYETWDG